MTKTKIKKKEFTSNVTGEEWYKHNSAKWNRVISQTGIIIEDETHQGKFEEGLSRSTVSEMQMEKFGLFPH